MTGSIVCLDFPYLYLLVYLAALGGMSAARNTRALEVSVLLATLSLEVEQLFRS